MEELALAKETDEAAASGWTGCERAGRPQEQLAALVARWEREKAGLNRVGELKEQLDDLRGQAERAQRDADLETASRLMYGEIPQLERQLAAAAATAGEESGTGQPGPGDDGPPMVKEQVGPDDIAEVVSPGPASPPAGCWKARPASCCGWRTSWASASSASEPPSRRCPTPCAGHGPASPTRTGRPGSFLFLGPTGVGKTELAKALAEFLFDDERAMDPHRHERVRREALGRAAGRRAARLRRLRGGRPAHRGRPPPAVLRRAAGRGGEGAPGGLRRAAPGAR